MTPDATAVVCGARVLTYAGLEARSRQIAAALHDRGVVAGARVGVCLDRSVDMVAAVLGVLRAGAAYVPIDPAYPADRIAFLSKDAGLSAVVAHAASPVQAAAVPRIDLDELCADTAAPSPALQGGAYRPDDLAYLIYTSGSTGQPKGVAVTRANLAFSTAARFAYYRTPLHAYLLVSSFAFDSSVAGLFWTLAAGGMLVVPEPGVEREPARLAALIERHHVSHMLALPALYRLVLEQHDRASLASLRVAIVAGEACPGRVAAEHRIAAPQAELYNEYGPTEATVWCTVHRAEGSETGPSVPIGRAIPGAHVYIVRDDGTLAPEGEPGELWVGGPGVAQGYHNRPELTAERFVPDPRGADGARVYRSGDLVRVLPDGALDFLGRIDQQVKVRGHRIELGEVEATLAGHPSVAEAAASAPVDERGLARLVAHVVARPGSSPVIADLREFLSARLPDYMVPSAIMLVPDLPRSANGKVDRAALPAVPQGRDGLQQAYAPPRDALEIWIAAAWGEVLQVPRVGRHDPFFELGGTSIQAAEFVNRLQRTLDEFVFVVLIFECPTVAELAARLKADYADALVRASLATPRPARRASAGDPAPRVDETMIADAVRLIERPRLAVDPPGRTRNPTAIFVLAPPRSGTTLLAAMLGGDPDLKVTAELNLFGFDRMAARRRQCQGPASVWLDGTIRAVMDIYGLSADDAVARVAAAEDADVTIADFLATLQRAVAPRVLVDKSPAYALSTAALRQIEDTIENARFVHLSRHPYAMVTSFADRHMDQIYFNHRGFTAKQAGELVWVIAHRRIADLLRSVPADRHVHVRYEDLVRAPEAEMRRVAAALGRPFLPGMLDPYANDTRSSLAGVRPESKPLGDPVFHAFDRITTARADVASGIATDNFLGEPAIALARDLGYEMPSASAPPAADGQDRARQTRQALQQRLARRRASNPSQVTS